MDSVRILQQRIHRAADVGIHVHGIDDANIGMRLHQILERQAHILLIRTPRIRADEK